MEGLIGGIVGGLIVAVSNIILQDRKEIHALKLQKAQWDKEEERAEAAYRREEAQRLTEWDRRRTDQQAEWDRRRDDAIWVAEQERTRQREEGQQEILRELQTILPVLNRASMAIYEELRSQYLHGKKSSEEPDASPSEVANLEEHIKQFNDLEKRALSLIRRVENDKIRKAAALIYQLDRHMALLRPSTWDSADLYSGHTPTVLSVDRWDELDLMIGRVLRGDPIDDIQVEDFVHKAES